jgi:hypothetical protein
MAVVEVAVDMETIKISIVGMTMSSAMAMVIVAMVIIAMIATMINVIVMEDMVVVVAMVA